MNIEDYMKELQKNYRNSKGLKSQKILPPEWSY